MPLSKNEFITIGLVFLAFAAFMALGDYAFAPVYYFFRDLMVPRDLAYFIAYLFKGIPLFVVSYYVFPGLGNWLEGIGLNKNIAVGLRFGVICTLPMFLGYGLGNTINDDFTPSNFWRGALMAGFFEELFYRSMFFGLLYRKTRLGFLPALLLSALLFASAHLYQSDNAGEMAGIFIMTLMGAGLFAWLYAEWKFNLWVPIFLHFLMNLSWMLFDAGDNALGGINANVFRFMTIAIAIIGTIVFKRRMGSQMSINKQSIWMKAAPLD